MRPQTGKKSSKIFIKLRNLEYKTRNHQNPPPPFYPLLRLYKYFPKGKPKSSLRIMIDKFKDDEASFVDRIEHSPVEEEYTKENGVG